MENWQSEYLQFTLFILGTVWLVQRGSPESKAVGQGRAASPTRSRRSASTPRGLAEWARVGGWRTRVYSHSLGLLMTAILLGRGSPSS